MSNKVLKDLSNISKNVKFIDKNNNLNNLTPGTKWKIETEGEVKDMSKMTIENLAKIVIDGFNKVNSRLDVLENDVKEINSLPTVKNELKSQKKKK